MDRPPPPTPSPVRVPYQLRTNCGKALTPSPTLPLSPLSHPELSLSLEWQLKFHFFFLDPSPGPLAGLSSSSLRPLCLDGPGVLHKRTFPLFILPKWKRTACVEVLSSFTFASVPSIRRWRQGAIADAVGALARFLWQGKSSCGCWPRSHLKPLQRNALQAQERRAGEAVSLQPHTLQPVTLPPPPPQADKRPAPLLSVEPALGCHSWQSFRWDQPEVSL